ncbi:hypothetical protein AM500_22485 [Bacillus sp. FJAT-18017]|uniref:hypothetical protein n=1 Tax=Bacillus sp. FJAT-18017 TaxID=1705566 RepID=UPI0006B016CC|nr:hypothetical protein [Bacillus sp. FJAT-18017]ALC92230.1 hypothetical protein AM500_22485 [Bacillus sp. FJAT-18017]
MFFSNDDIAGLLESCRRGSNVGGAQDDRRKRKDDRHDNRRNRSNEDVAGIFDENFRVRVNASIDGDDFCRAVRRCLIRDLVGGIRDDNDDNRDHHKCKCRR